MELVAASSCRALLFANWRCRIAFFLFLGLPFLGIRNFSSNLVGLYRSISGERIRRISLEQLGSWSKIAMC